MMKKKVGKINDYNIIGVNIQILLTIAVVILTMVTLCFNKKLLSVLEIVVSLDLFIMAHNNNRIYHKNKVTILYIIFGIGLLLYALLTLIGVV